MYRKAMLVVCVVLWAAVVSYSQQRMAAVYGRDARCGCRGSFTLFEGGGTRSYGGGGGYGGGYSRRGSRGYDDRARSATDYAGETIGAIERGKRTQEQVEGMGHVWAERRREAEARAVRAAKGDRWQPTRDWRAPRMDPSRYREVDPGRGQLRYDPSRIGSSYFREPVYAGRSTSEGYSRSRDAGAVRDRTRDTAPRETKSWFERVLERGSRRP